MWLGVTDIKKELKSNLTPYFKEKGFQFKTGIQGASIGYIEKSKSNFAFLFFNVNSIGKVWVSHMCCYLDKVERTLFSIQLPDKSAQYYYERPYNTLNHISIIENNNFRDRLESDTIYSKEDIHRFCDKIIEYMETKGLTFMKRNNSLEKVYNQIIRNWKNKNLDPISEHQDNYFKALIILKLMKDPNIEDYKAQFSEKLLAYRNPEDWLHSFKNLCDLLDSPDFEKEYLI